MLKSTRDAPQTSRTLAAASASSPFERREGDVLAGKYLLMRPLGMGGMGQVWVARNLATNAEVAAKVLLPERAVVGDALERFRREAQTTASLWHRGIVRAFDLVELDRDKGSLLLVMELLHGETLGQRLEKAPGGRLPIEETVRVLVPILSALDHAHRVGVVHRDLKPDNVFLAVDPDGERIPKLVDFGISKLRHSSTSITACGALVGTPCYMSPEQARGEAVDGRSDVFAVGILLHECLAGAPPFGGQTLHEVVHAILEGSPALPADVPAPLRAVVLRALAKRPEDRYATAGELADALVAAVPAAALTFASTPPGPASLVSVPPTSLTSVAPAVAHTTMGQRAPRSRGALVAFVAAAGCIVALSAGSLRGAIGRAARQSGESVAELAPRGSKRVTVDHDVIVEAAAATRAPSARTTSTHHRAAPAPNGSLPAVTPSAVTPPPAPTLLRDPGF